MAPEAKKGLGILLMGTKGKPEEEESSADEVAAAISEFMATPNPTTWASLLEISGVGNSVPMGDDEEM